LKRDERQMKHVYIVIEDEQKTKSHLLNKFIDADGEKLICPKIL